MTTASATTPPIVADVHIHTRHSHGQATVEEMVVAARTAGLKVIGFSEHSPRPEGFCYAQDYQESLNRTYPDYVREVCAFRDELAPQGVQVLLGTEFDYIPSREDFARQFCSAYDYDYVIGGLHFQGTWGFDASAEEWAGLSRDACYAAYVRYYQDLTAMCASGFFNVVAHPDLIKIFSKTTFDSWLEDSASLALVRQTLTAAKDNGLAMEISSAGLRKSCNEIYPGPKVMEIARDVQVPISFGSDAHCTKTPAYGFDRLAHYAISYGYTHSLVFAGRTPKQIPISL